MVDMDEFLGIAIWVILGFLIVNMSLIWFASQPTIAEKDNFGLQGLTPDFSLTTDDLNGLQSTIALTDCATASADALQYSGCLIAQFAGGIVQSATGAVTLIGKMGGLLWNMLFGWHTVLTQVLGGNLYNYGGKLFVDILTIIFGGIELGAIFIIFLKVAGIIRGGS